MIANKNPVTSLGIFCTSLCSMFSSVFFYVLSIEFPRGGITLKFIIISVNFLFLSASTYQDKYKEKLFQMYSIFITFCNVQTWWKCCSKVFAFFITKCKQCWIFKKIVQLLLILILLVLKATLKIKMVVLPISSGCTSCTIRVHQKSFQYQCF